MAIRPARADELERLRAIERSAGARFAEIPEYARVADDEPLEVEELAVYQRAGRAWVAAADGGLPLGYVLADTVDGALHIEQLSVVPEHQGRGIGGTLVQRVVADARRRGLDGVTLTTFHSVPWNGPYYERLGFRPLGDDEIGPELAAVVAGETEHGLDPAARVCMRLAVPGG